MDNHQSLGPGEVATRLGIGERTARRLMAAGTIPCMRSGAKLLRTSEEQLASYQRAQYRLQQSGPAARQLMNTIACLREIERMCDLSDTQRDLLTASERQLAALEHAENASGVA